MEPSKRWSRDDTLEELKAFYYLYHIEILGYKPMLGPEVENREWYILELEAFDWYSDCGNFRYEALERSKEQPNPVVKRKTKSKQPTKQSPFGDES